MVKEYTGAEFLLIVWNIIKRTSTPNIVLKAIYNACLVKFVNLTNESGTYSSPYIVCYCMLAPRLIASFPDDRHEAKYMMDGTEYFWLHSAKSPSIYES